MTQDDRITDLEIQIAHQAHTLDELSGEVHRQEGEIAKLRRQLDAVIGHLRDSDETDQNTNPDVKPPHW